MSGPGAPATVSGFQAQGSHRPSGLLAAPQTHPAPQPWLLSRRLLTSPQPRVGPCSLPLLLSLHEHLSCPVSTTDRNPRWAALSSASCWPLRTIPSPLTRRHLLGDPYLPTAPQAPQQVLPILHHPHGLQEAPTVCLPESQHVAQPCEQRRRKAHMRGGRGQEGIVGVGGWELGGNGGTEEIRDGNTGGMEGQRGWGTRT